MLLELSILFAILAVVFALVSFGFYKAWTFEVKPTQPYEITDLRIQ